MREQWCISPVMPAVQEVVKTTDMGVLLKNIPYDKRIYSIEDSRVRPHCKRR